MDFLLYGTYSIFLGAHILLNTSFSNTLNPCSALRVRHQVSHPYKTRSEITVLYNLSFMELARRRENKKTLN
jgi:hypothetical protein